MLLWWGTMMPAASAGVTPGYSVLMTTQARCSVEMLTAARENIRFATTAPPMHPITCAGR